MGSIIQKAQQQQAKESYKKIMHRLKGLTPDTPEWKDALKRAIDDMVQTREKLPTEARPAAQKNPWDFSHEKSQTAFIADELVILCPITLSDEDFYSSVRMQYSLMYRAEYHVAKDRVKAIFSSETLSPKTFYCIIRDSKENQPIGYLGINDTSADLWEIAIELDGPYTHRGFGSRGIRLYLNEIQRITGMTEFRAAVEVDNIPSQKCFEKLGAKLVGLRSGALLKTNQEKKRFEEKNLDLIDANMLALAERLGVEPRKLLSHVLDYRLTCPL